MNRRPYRITFRMNAKEFERFDRVRRSRGLGYYPWTTFILDSLERECTRAEERNPNLLNRPASLMEKLVDTCAGKMARPRPSDMDDAHPCSPAKPEAKAAKKRRPPKTDLAKSFKK